MMVKTKTSLNPTQLNAANQTPYLDIDSKQDVDVKDAECLQGKAVIIVDPQGGGTYGAANPLNITVADPTTPTQKAAVQFGGANNFPISQGLSVNSVLYLYNFATFVYEATRTPTIWKSGLFTAAGSTVIWAAVAGKKHRIMGWRVTLVNGTTAAAASLLTLLDAAAATGIGVQICGAAMGAVATSSIIVNESYMNGYLSAAVNTDWNINLSTALAVAGVFVQVWGTEE